MRRGAVGVAIILASALLAARQAADPDVHGFLYPIAGACLPKGAQLMPNATRDYRKGVHEGIDFYNSDNCTRITRGTTVLAAKGGTVVRADVGYVRPTLAQNSAALKDPNTDASVDQFRGRQVWIDHGGGVVTRYCHLDGIVKGIAAGVIVTAGQPIAMVGETGTPSSYTNPGHEYHLHFEVRIGESYLGKGLPIAKERELYRGLFKIQAAVLSLDAMAMARRSLSLPAPLRPAS
jgi:murein DD-endopeptidase MepM/ murein hydrolase activator NlpD